MKKLMVAALAGVSSMFALTANADSFTTSSTAYGYTRRVQVGDDPANVYIVNVYTNTATAGWTMDVPPGVTSIDYMVVGGGGSGGNVQTTAGGGGGAGGFVTNKLTVAANDVIKVVVGGGGSNGNGANSTLSLNSSVIVTAKGGGKGGNGINTSVGVGSAGGSGGGGSWNHVGGSGTTGQGNAGGGSTTNGAGGGGGAGSAGGNVTASYMGGNGGTGVQCDITGELKWYAAGGGAGLYTKTGFTGTYGRGGNEIGGDGGHVSTVNAKANGCPAVDCTGSGGGGASGISSSHTGGRGGSGIVALRYKEVADKYSFDGGTVVLTPASAVYDGTQKSFALVSVTLLNGKVMTASDLEEGEDYDLVPASVGPQSGTHQVSLVGKGDRCYGSAVTTFTIEKTVPIISGALSHPGWAWGTNPTAPVSTLVSDYGTVAFRYYTDELCTVSFVPSAATDPGTYYVRGEVSASANWTSAATDPVAFVVNGDNRPSQIVKTDTDFGAQYTMSIANMRHIALAYTNCTQGVTNEFVVPFGVRSLECLVVAGGGAGGRANSQAENSIYVGGGGGGAGGYVSRTIDVKGGDVVKTVVGRGGVAANGANSVLIVNDTVIVTAVGGGRGGNGYGDGGTSGGSGGGTTWNQGTARPRNAGTRDQGNAGGLSTTVSGYGVGGGGGGAGACGGDWLGGYNGGNGGVGLCCSITGDLVWYAAGGGGGASNASGAGGTGGSGIGGAGGAFGNAGRDARACTGSGGGGAGKTQGGAAGGKGGSGIVILRYRNASGLVILFR